MNKEEEDTNVWVLMITSIFLILSLFSSYLYFTLMPPDLVPKSIFELEWGEVNTPMSVFLSFFVCIGVPILVTFLWGMYWIKRKEGEKC